VFLTRPQAATATLETYTTGPVPHHFPQSLPMTLHEAQVHLQPVLQEEAESNCYKLY
jgi:hypothetical protein